MNIFRPGFIHGALRHLAILPRLILTVHGWPALLADCMGRRHQPYQLRTRSGVVCSLRPGCSDWWIFLELFVFDIYGLVRQDILRAQTIIDIGANVGYFALHAASLKPQAEIHAFEPFPANLEQLQKNVSLNRFKSIHPHPQAISDKSGSAQLFFTPGDDSGCSLAGSTRGQSCTVKVLGVNELFGTCGLTHCDLLKMDCEGSELAILSAIAPETLAQIEAIIMEYHVQEQLPTLQAILTQSGFTCQVLPAINTLYARRS